MTTLTNKNVMIDIETLDTDPTAVVLAIGAVVFDPFTGDVEDEYFYASLPIQEQIDMGRTVSESTLAWWTSPDRAEAWTRMAANKLNSVDTALEGLASYFQDKAGAGVPVWANSPSFDCVILSSLFEDYYIDMPWGFRDQMDVRTLANVAFLPNERPDTSYGLAHDPVHDCVSQIKLVAASYGQLVALAKKYGSRI